MLSKLLALLFLCSATAPASPLADENITNAYKQQLASGARIFADPALLGERESRLMLRLTTVFVWTC